MFIPSGEKIVETKKCRLSGKEFVITDCDLEFYDKVSPVFGGRKYSIPSPTLCPDERMRQIQCFRNERNLYTRKSSLSGKDIISVYQKESPYLVYSPEEFFSDNWSACEYCTDVDFSKPFFVQFNDLLSRVPQVSLNQSLNENSTFCHEGMENKSCYLLYNGSQNEHTYYSYFVWRNKNSLDCAYVKDSECCYSCTDVQKCYHLFYSNCCTSCTHSCYLFNCEACSDCFGCVNQRHGKNMILNSQLTKEQYDDFLKNFSVNQELQNIFFTKFQKLKDTAILKSYQGYGSENISGNNIYSSKNVFGSYEINESENVNNSISVEFANNIHDCYMCRKSEFCYYNEVSTVQSSYINFSSVIFNQNSRIFYSRLMNYAADCFGCISLHSHEHHCIFNKSYSVQEYEILCGKVIDHMRSTGEWGEFFPHEISPFGYNETVAQEYFPVTEEEVRAKGWKWYTEEDKKYEGVVYHPLPISQYDERVVGFEKATENINTCLAGMVQCDITKKPFKLIRQELAFYIENGIPIPTKHPDQRHKERMVLRNPRVLYERTCLECHKNIITTYAPERSEKIVCEECYRKLVY